mgnify:CR=1 FL=1
MVERPDLPEVEEQMEMASAAAASALIDPSAAELMDDEDIHDEELEELLIQEITIDGMCGVY